MLMSSDLLPFLWRGGAQRGNESGSARDEVRQNHKSRRKSELENTTVSTLAVRYRGRLSGTRTRSLRYPGERRSYLVSGILEFA